jgi:hypothetical protein
MIVLIPLAWGVFQSVLKSRPLLQISATTHAAAARDAFGQPVVTDPIDIVK